jgi:L-threonylcarbamoyladenylate synthase
VNLDEDIRRAVGGLRAGRLVVLPTDTVYGLAGAPGAPGAIEAMFEAKVRRLDKPLAVLAARTEDLRGVVVVDERARVLAARYWPGPLTLVLPRDRACDWDLGASTNDTIAVRVPNCTIALRVLEEAGPLAVTSANRSGDAPATTVAEARAALGAFVEVFVDGGRRAGAVSTVVSLAKEATVLRSGALDPEEVLSGLPEPPSP